MKAGSSVTTPVLLRRFVMSIPRSFSVPTTTGNSRSCPPMWIRALSATASPRSYRTATPAFRAGLRKSQARLWFGQVCRSPGASATGSSEGVGCSVGNEAREQPEEVGWRRAVVRGPRVLKDFRVSESPSDRADRDSGGRSGRDIDRVIADIERPRRIFAELCAEAEEARRVGLLRRLVAADDTLELVEETKSLEDLPGKVSGLVGEHGARRGRRLEQFRDARVGSRFAQEPARIFVAPRFDGLGKALLVRGAQRTPDEAFGAFADEAPDLALVALGKAERPEHGVDGVGQVAARIDQRSVQIVDDCRHHGHLFNPRLARSGRLLYVPARAADDPGRSGAARPARATRGRGAGARRIRSAHGRLRPDR